MTIKNLFGAGLLAAATLLQAAQALAASDVLVSTEWLEKNLNNPLAWRVVNYKLRSLFVVDCMFFTFLRSLKNSGSSLPCHKPKDNGSLS